MFVSLYFMEEVISVVTVLFTSLLSSKYYIMLRVFRNVMVIGIFGTTSYGQVIAYHVIDSH